MQTCFRSLVKKVEQTDGLIDTFEILAQLKLRIAKGREGKYIEQCDSNVFRSQGKTVCDLMQC